MPMLEIDDKIISTEIFEREFVCDLSQCKGECCVQGDSGAPLEPNEVEKIRDHFEQILPYMTENGIKSVREHGFGVIDSDGELGTPLIDNQACAYIFYSGDIALCAIEQAYNDGKIDFQKPISCHLYPIRTTKHIDFTALNFHKWDICKSALKKGKMTQTPVFQFLKAPIIRQFGSEFFEQLEIAHEHFSKNE